VNTDRQFETKFGHPQVQIQIDDYNILLDGDCPSLLEKDIAISPGQHEIRIQHYGKGEFDFEFLNAAAVGQPGSGFSGESGGGAFK